MDEVLFKQNFEFSRAAGHFPLHCSVRLSAVKVWKTEHAQQSFTASAGLGQCFSAVYTNTFTSKVSRGLDKPNPKLLGQDEPWVE